MEKAMQRGVSEEPQGWMTPKLDPNTISEGMTTKDKLVTDAQKHNERGDHLRSIC